MAQTSATYQELVARLRKEAPGNAAFELAVGGDFQPVGRLQYALLRGLGVNNSHLVIDVGCGSGRLAYQLSQIPGLSYRGLDVVEDLLEYARKLCRRSDWTFSRTSGDEIPFADQSADFVCFFSVFTHLAHQHSFRYLQEAKRVLRPSGLIVFSFLEFAVYSHWTMFQMSLDLGARQETLVQFMSRDAIHSWAHHLDLQVEHLWDGDKPHIEIPEPITWADGRTMTGLGALGQSVAVLRKKG